MTVNETKRYKEFLQKKKFVENVLQWRDLIGGRKFYIDGAGNFCTFYRLRVDGFYDFLESVLKDPKYADDVKEMKETMGNGNNNMARILSHVCPSVVGCQFWIWE